MKPPIERMVCESGYRYQTTRRWYDNAAMSFPDTFVSTAVTFSPGGASIMDNQAVTSAVLDEVLPSLSKSREGVMGAFDFNKFSQPHEVGTEVDWRRTLSQTFWLHCLTGIPPEHAAQVDRALYDRLDGSLQDYYLPQNFDKRQRFYTEMADGYVDSCRELGVAASTDAKMLQVAHTNEALGCKAESTVAAAMGVRILKLYQRHSAAEDGTQFAGVPLVSEQVHEQVAITKNFIIVAA